MDADGGNPRRLTTSGAYNVTPRWSPKGDRIVYARQGGGGFQIHAINPDGSQDTQLTTLGSNEHPRWSPDGRFIVFSSNRDGEDAIYLMRADGSAQTRVSRGKVRDSHPTWSSAW
jgi:TolB protein